MSTCLVSAYEGAHACLTEVTLPTIAEHASRYGHTLVLAQETDRRAHFDYSIKVAALRWLLPDYDSVIWIDSDCVVLDDAPDLAGLTLGHWMAVGFRLDLYATCLWALRHDPRSFALLDLLWEHRDSEMLDANWYYKFGPPSDNINMLSTQKFPLHLITSQTHGYTTTGVVHSATGQGYYLDIAVACLRDVREAQFTVKRDTYDMVLALTEISAHHPWPPDHLTRRSPSGG